MLFSSWTYISDDDDRNYGSLILYDPIIKLSEIMSVVSNSFRNNIIVLITSTPEIYSHLNIITYTYFDISNIKSLLVNYNVELIIFDDVVNLYSISSLCDFRDIYPKIIILSTWGDEIANLQFILERIPNIKLLNFSSEHFKPIHIKSIRSLDATMTNYEQNVLYSSNPKLTYTTDQRELMMNTFSKGIISINFIPTINIEAMHIINFTHMQDVIKITKISKNIYIYLDDITNINTINKIKYYNDAYMSMSQGSNCVYTSENELLISN